VTNWGTGEPRREVLHVEDMARACLHLLENYDGSDHVNIGSGVDVTIAELAALVANSCDFAGTTNWDATRPDGTPQKLLDVSKLKENGWVSQISLEQGLASTIAWFRENSHLIRE
jgi:GDP-L-fucose synthase